jgi:hypothetical protein
MMTAGMATVSALAKASVLTNKFLSKRLIANQLGLAMWGRMSVMFTLPCFIALSFRTM